MPKANAKPAPKKATPPAAKKDKHFYYAVTIFVDRIVTDLTPGEFVRHYTRNNDAVQLFDSNEELRAAQDKAVAESLKRYSHLMPPEQKGGRRK